MKRKGFAGLIRQKQYVIAGAIVVIAAIAATAIYSDRQEQQREQMEERLAEEVQEQEPEPVAAAEETEEAAEASAVILPETAEETVRTVESERTEETEATEETAGAAESAARQAAPTASVQETLHFSPEDGMIWPMEGNVIVDYSMDNTVYFATLDQYKYNPAVIIEGEVNDKVYSVAKGRVTDISNSEVTGCTMTVELGDGYEAIYGQLKEPNFAVGDYVEPGHVLGFVAEPTKYFSVEGSNLYFALEKDGEPVDPVAYFE